MVLEFLANLQRQQELNQLSFIEVLYPVSKYAMIPAGNVTVAAGFTAVEKTLNVALGAVLMGGADVCGGGAALA